MFRRVLIANRGEIAVRVTQTLQQMGITAVSVYAQPDRNAMHVRQADEAYLLDGMSAADTYLRSDKIIDIAKTHNIDAIHPGYGFLSENATFAKMCQDDGISFIGPSADVITNMGDKLIAKKVMGDAGIPVVPGLTVSVKDAASISKDVAKIGYPVLVKAAAGGGGKGMRLVASETDLADAMAAAQREAKSAFGDDRVFIEKYIDKPRHVEIQIFGDTHGHVVHLFERECSIQRRHQKIIEESPSTALTPKLRQQMGEAAVQAAKAIGYTNAGTVEFILDQAGQFYFLEVNTRLQVEHPVTEFITQQDLVQAQLLVADGQPLPFNQDSLKQTGHALEARIYAEDPQRNFLPSTGTIIHYVPPAAPYIRVDSGVSTGSEVTVHYDPMLAKLIVWGATREESLRRMTWALRHFVIMGVTTNIEFLRHVIEHPAFIKGDLHTHFLDEHEVSPPSDDDTPDAVLIAAAYCSKQSSHQVTNVSGSQNAESNSPWLSGGSWRAF